MTSPEHSRSPSVRPESAHPAADDLGFDLPEPAKLSRRRALTFAVLGAGLFGAAFLFGYLPRRQAKAELVENARAEAESAPRVEVVSPKITSSDRAIVLSGSVRPLEETVIYPRANGYIAKWLVDIGDKVKEGQTMAEIETPELDQELDQARAQLAQASAGVTQADANRDFSEANLQRFKQLVPAGVASQQDLDKTRAQSVVDSASVKVARSGVAVQAANIRRLLQLKSFAHVLSPFAGTVTARNIERGSLVSAGNATPLFKVAILDPVRVFVQVPQDAAAGVQNGIAAQVSTREFPGRIFEGKVARSSGALEQSTRTMLVEVRVPNPKNELLAGMYAQVALTLPSSHRVLELPATALLNDAKGLRVALVDPDDRLRLVPVTVERDIGATVQIASGISDDARVVKLSSADMVDGKRVQVRK
ncbi:MAG TPA: efflux RND transporter periplasmic adaptor subunit [Polyangiaceae bacterium]|nr:efflux RND transporter periplasmic adaptor subunit [Polyangiaceae bacterium]